ncbi:MAG TPA: hypothetical protein PKC22_08790 [Rhodocyclaceae bacterium]|nr:hypothetical protein [Rhodocyclaceae bacterium]
MQIERHDEPDQAGLVAVVLAQGGRDPDLFASLRSVPAVDDLVVPYPDRFTLAVLLNVVPKRRVFCG